MHQTPRTIVITGCSSGFGHDLALKLARRGDRVYATMRAPDGRNAGVAQTGDATVDLADPAAAEVAGSWRVEEATGAYAGHTGSGTLTGSADMTLPQPRGLVRYAGTLRADA